MRAAGVLSASGRCAAFDAAADGFVRSEGYAMMLFEAAEENSIGDEPTIVVGECALAHVGGRSAGFVVPSASVEFDVMRRALGDADAAGLLVECHASATPLGDPIEATALAQLSAPKSGGQNAQGDESLPPPPSPLTLHAAKTRFGHCEAAAGAVGLMCAIAILEVSEMSELTSENMKLA